MKYWPTVMTSVVFGLSIVFLPVPLRQLPLPEGVRRHKALAYFSQWDDPRTVGWNIFLLVLAGLGVLAVGLAAAGAFRRRRKVQ